MIRDQIPTDFESGVLWILGDSGHAREIERIARDSDPLSQRWKDIRRIEASYEPRVLATGGDVVLGMGSPAIRAAVVARLSRHSLLRWPHLMHPTSHLAPDSHIDRGAVVAPLCSLSVNVRIHEWSMINAGVTVGHDAKIGPMSLVNPSATISGGVQIGKQVLIGAGAVVLEGRRIGDGAVVGAGAVVTRDVDPRTVVIGVPAKVLRRIEGSK